MMMNDTGHKSVNHLKKATPNIAFFCDHLNIYLVPHMVSDNQHTIWYSFWKLVVKSDQ